MKAKLFGIVGIVVIALLVVAGVHTVAFEVAQSVHSILSVGGNGK